MYSAFVKFIDLLFCKQNVHVVPIFKIQNWKNHSRKTSMSLHVPSLFAIQVFDSNAFVSNKFCDTSLIHFSVNESGN